VLSLFAADVVIIIGVIIVIESIGILLLPSRKHIYIRNAITIAIIIIITVMIFDVALYCCLPPRLLGGF